MPGERSTMWFTILSCFIITIISAAPLEHHSQQTNSTSSNKYVQWVPEPATCVAGNCTGGTCGLCPHDPLRCCLLTPGRCTSIDGVPYGLCAPKCDCDVY
ncbi:unnamed protein product [Adineta ricciae]|uniref:Uncharacterized protein n=1 Tax=Adineta ricciae TaxID=249248 RepID=A0A816FGP6_ADIRI|nr:unnamed protein product [Adineta ricciae]